MSNNDFLPVDYTQPKGNSNYLKLEKGETKFRILSKPIVGWLDWKDKKPYRFPMNQKPSAPSDPKQPIKHFWAFVVFDYKDELIKILEITQGSIQTAIKNLTEDKDWGSPFKYDIKITKSGDGMDTKYTINPVPHKEVTEFVKQSFTAAKVDLQALWVGGDPFANSTPPPQKEGDVIEEVAPEPADDDDEELPF